MNWHSDWELRARMVAVLGLLLLFLVALPLGLYWSIRFAFTLPMVFAHVKSGAPLVPYTGIVAGPIFGIVGVLVVFLIVLWLEVAARRSADLTDPAVVDGLAERGDDTSPAPTDLTARVTRLAQQVDLPAPDVLVRDSRTPNAYTKGLTRGRTRIVVTTGLLAALDPAELDAVLAHELAHIKNRDAVVMTIGSLVFVVTRHLMDADDRLESMSDRRDDSFATLSGFFVFAVTPVAWAFWSVSRAFVRILSQYREYVADRGAVAITGNPAALAGALAKLDRLVGAVPTDDLRDSDPLLSAFYVVPVPEESVRPTDDEDDFDIDDYTGFGMKRSEPLPTDGFLTSLSEAGSATRQNIDGATDLPTHPPTEKRIARLRSLETAQETR